MLRDADRGGPRAGGGAMGDGATVMGERQMKRQARRQAQPVLALAQAEAIAEVVYANYTLYEGFDVTREELVEQIAEVLRQWRTPR